MKNLLNSCVIFLTVACSTCLAAMPTQGDLERWVRQFVSTPPELSIPPVLTGEESERPDAGTREAVAETIAPPPQDDMEQWVRQFGDQNPTVREAAIRRLLPYPQAASELIVQAFRSGGLSTRLAALELLKEWKAPVDLLDPWQPETLTPERLAALDDWQKEAVKSTAPMSRELTADQRVEISKEIARISRVSDAEAEAIRERLARWGAALLPQVYEQLKAATTDRERQQLQALRYRLVAGGSLAERWPGGLLRLAAPETATRQKSAEELAHLATAEDQMLLRELFSNPDPLVREISLRGIQKIGGETQTMLLDLLADPEPNVRAAVLKQLEENPGPGTSLKITEYVKTEKDPDLVGHAVRVLRTLHQQKDGKATRCLIDLLKHDSWQVRADAASALGGNSRDFSSYDNGKLNEEDQLRVDTYVALLELLEDNDGFVVSKAVEGLKNIDMSLAVEPLLKVIERSPDLASLVIKILVKGEKMRAKAMPRLLALCRHDDPRIRAAIIGNINLPEEDIAAGIKDTDSRVRIAAAKALFRRCEILRMQKAVRRASLQVPSESPGPAADSTWSNVVRTFVDVVDGLSGPPSPDPVNTAVETQPVESPTMELSPQEGIVPATIAPTAIDAPIAIETVEQTNVDPFDLQPNIPLDDSSLSALDFPEISNTDDQWLLDFYQGKGRPDWMSNLIEPLEKMRSAESLEEQIVAAAALVPLGKSEEMVPFLMEATKDKPEFFDSFREIVPWLVWEKRLALFHQWRALNKPQEAQIVQFLRCFINSSDPRCEAVLWEMLGEENVSMTLVDNIYNQLKQFYRIDVFAYNPETLPSKKIRDELVDKLLARANAGSENQRLIAVAMLVTIDADKAYEVAERLDADSSRSDEFRRDMFQIKLLSQTNEKLRTELAVETLKQKDTMRNRLALLSLVHGSNALHSLRKQINLTLPYSPVSGFNRQQGTQQLPRGLELESIKPLINDDNEEIAAHAGYLAVLLGDPSGMEPLLKYWKKINSNGVGDHDFVYGGNSIRVLVYHAIASLDDPQYIPVLREIYDKLGDGNIRDFYWTIRSMTGPEILKFRKEIRDKYGMENLR